MMKKIIIVTLLTFFILFIHCNAFACNGVTIYPGYLWDDYGCLIDYIDEGVDVDILEPSPVFPDRTNICINGTIGSFYTDYLSYYIEDSEESGEYFEEYEEYEYMEEEEYDSSILYLCWDFAPTEIYSRVTGNLVLRDENYNPIGLVPIGAKVEVIQLSPYYPERMEVVYDGLYGSVLACYIEQIYTDPLA